LSYFICLKNILLSNQYVPFLLKTGIKFMQKSIIAIVAIMITGMVLIYYIQTSHNRFAIVIGADGQTYQIDKRSGHSWIIADQKKIPLDDPETPRPRMRELEVTTADMSAFSVEGRLSKGTLLGTIYNGSDTPMTRAVLSVAAKEPDGTLRWTRNISDTLFIRPMETGRFTISVTNSEGVGDVIITLAKVFTRPMTTGSPAGR
jgi:hypothetical protein